MGTKYWWANQGDRWRPERALGHVFAPDPNSSTNFQQGWDNVIYLRPGHVILHNLNFKIRAISQVASPPRPSRRPKLSDETDAEKNVAGYNSSGNLVEVEYFDLKSPIPVREIPHEWRIGKYGPFLETVKKRGHPDQIYIAPLSSKFVEMLRRDWPDYWPPDL